MSMLLLNSFKIIKGANSQLFNRRSLVLISLLVFSGIFFGVHSALAWLDVPYNISDMHLNALDFIDPIVRFFIVLALLAALSGTFIFISANLLDWASSLPFGLNNALVHTGWQFMSGLANMFFILIFIFIAFSYIFKIEARGTQKALPRLIIIAFLVNFSFLFVGMAADTGWIIQNSFRGVFFEDKGLAAWAIQPLINSVLDIIKVFAAVPVAYLTKNFLPVPFAAPAAAIAVAMHIINTGAGGLVGSFLSSLSQSIIVILFNFIAGFIFLVYAVLFLARIAIVWLLAIISPLAFLAFILPQTQRYFQHWLRTLFQWVFLGVVAFFLMGLGIRLFLVFSAEDMTPIEGLGDWSFPGIFYKYIFLLIYLIVAFSAARKWTPMGTEAIWSLGQKATLAGGVFAAYKARRAAMAGEIAGRERLVKTKKDISQRLAEGLPLSRTQRALRPFVAGIDAEAYGRRSQTLKNIQMNESRARLRKKLKMEGMDEETVKSLLISELEREKSKGTARDKNKTQALIELMAEKDALKEKYRGLYEESWRRAGPDDFKNNRVKRLVLSRMPHWGTNADKKAIFEKLKVSQIDDWGADAKENEETVRRTVATLRSDLITRLGIQSNKARKLVEGEIERTIGASFRNLTTGETDIDKLSDEGKKKLLERLEVIRHLHLSVLSDVQTWKKYGTMKKGQPDNVDNFIEKLRKKMAEIK